MSSDERLLAAIDTREKYDEFKRLWVAVKVIRQSPTGPFYAGLPLVTNSLDSYDPDKEVLSLDLNAMKTYATLLHGTLTGQYDLGSTMPRYRKVSSLDRHSVGTFFAAFTPMLSRPLAESCMTRWDRNTTAFYPSSEKPFSVPANVLYWNRSNPERAKEFEDLIPLYRDYRAEGENTIVNETGIPLDRNLMVIARYLITFFNSANDYQKKLKEVAEIVQVQNTLTEIKQKLTDQAVSIQREKQRDVNQALSQSNRISVYQQEVLRRFESAYRQAMNQLNAPPRQPPRR